MSHAQNKSIGEEEAGILVMTVNFLSLLTRALGIPCLMWEPLQLLPFTICTCF